MFVGLWGACKGTDGDRGKGWKARPKKVKDLYPKSKSTRVLSPSTTGHEEPGGNPAGPSAKAKYSLMTDSEAVP
jgi:hypothetical protein